ncbi:kinesin-4-like, partial [Trifolium medium]|nr:kinesin-4-like [Trifolium medium]
MRPPPVQPTTQILKPRRRVSIATLRPDPTSEMTTPLRTSASRFTSGSNAPVMRSQRG